MKPPPRRRFRGRTHRLILSRFPTVGVFDDIAESEADERAAFELEALTNDRLTAAERFPGFRAARSRPEPGRRW